MSELLDAALRYAEMGYAVFPCADAIQLVPLTRHGFKDASTDPEQIAAWWTQFPKACIGMATAGLLVVDVDGLGNPWLTPERALELAQAPTARTPRGGGHYVFRKPAGAKWSCTVGKLAPHVDTRSDGGYIVVAPSRRPDGVYRWVEGLELDVPRDRLPVPPAWLSAALDALPASSPQARLVGPAPAEANQIPDGQRNATLARLAGTMRRVGMSQAEISAALNQANRDRCCPPLSPAEVERIAESIAHYEPDQVNVALVENHWAQMHDRASDEKSNIVWFSTIEPVEMQWLWPARIPAGRITLLVGLPGKGKSLLAIDVAARVSIGMPWPDGGVCPQGSAILITAEDNPNDTIRPRLDAAGADVERVGLLSMVRRRGADGRPTETPFTLADVAVLEKELARLPDCKLIVIDPIGSFLGSNTDAHRDNEVRAVLAPVAALAEKHGAAVLVVAHRRKSFGTLADDSALGSRAFTALARAVWHVSPDPDNKARRLLLPGKNNLAPEGHGLAFTIWGDPPSLHWERSPVLMSADDCLAAESKASKPGPRADARLHAVAWLRTALADGPRQAKELLNEAREAACLSPATLRRAREELGVEAYREHVPGPWYWRLPQGAHVEPAVSKGPEPEHLGHVAEVASVAADVAARVGQSPQETRLAG
jgi:putative DNA primase/helicase